MKKLSAVLFLLFGFSSFAKAAILFEPYAGYEIGKTAGTLETPADVEFKAQPRLVTGGLRLAYKPKWVWLGVDGAYGVGEYHMDPNKNSAVNVTSDPMVRKTGYAVLGVDLPILLRAWVGYGFYDSLKDTKLNKEFKGNAMKAGIGLSFGFLSLNAEVVKDTYTVYDTKDIKKTYSKYDSQSVIAGVSVPFNF